MKRKEFIETCSGLSRSELLEIAVNARKNVEKMISEDTKAMFHRLDEETVVEERYFETGWGKPSWCCDPAKKNSCNARSTDFMLSANGQL